MGQRAIGPASPVAFVAAPRLLPSCALVIAIALALVGCGVSGHQHAGTQRQKVVGHGQLQSRTTESSRLVSEPPAEGCFLHPGDCGYPDPAARTVGPAAACSSYPVSSGLITSFDGEMIENMTFTGQVVVDSNNITIKNVCILVNGHGFLNGDSGLSIQSGSGTVIEDSTIAGLNTSTRSLNWAVVNTSGKPATLKRDYIYNCGECIHDGPWTIDGTYAIANGMQGTTDHIETIYCDSGPGYADSINANDDTFLNPESYVAVLFCNTHNGAGGPCANQVTVTHSLLGGGGYVFYPCGNAASVGRSRITISDNRIARCTKSPLRFNTDAGGTACAGTSSHSIGAGADAHGYWPLGGYYGVQADAYCPPAPGQTWSGNVWDNNGAPVGC